MPSAPDEIERILVMTPLEKLQKRDEQRLRVLRYLYDATEGSGARRISFYGKEVGLSENDFEAAARYLDGQGLVETTVLSGPIMFVLTNEGIDEIESTIRDPNQKTDHFTPIVINVVNTWIENSSVGAVQVDGEGNSADVSQGVSHPKSKG